MLKENTRFREKLTFLTIFADVIKNNDIIKLFMTNLCSLHPHPWGAPKRPILNRVKTEDTITIITFICFAVRMVVNDEDNL